MILLSNYSWTSLTQSTRSTFQSLYSRNLYGYVSFCLVFFLISGLRTTMLISTCHTNLNGLHLINHCLLQPLRQLLQYQATKLMLLVLAQFVSFYSYQIEQRSSLLIMFFMFLVLIAIYSLPQPWPRNMVLFS